MIAYERRASTILFNVVTARELAGPVLLPANVCPVVPLTLCKAGRRFEFVDVSPSTLCIDHARLLERWHCGPDPPGGLIYVRTFGAVFDASELFAEIKCLTPSALIVDDRCTCAPSFATEPLTECIDAVLYSTGYSKFADIGFGGFALLQDRLAYRRATVAYDARDLAALTARYKNALDEAREFTYQDSNWLDSAEPELRWDAYRQAVELHANLASDTKRAINHVYAHELPLDIQLPPVFQSWRFNIHVAQKDALLHEIARNGLFASNHYAALNGIFGPGSGRVASSLHGHIVNLFNDQYFDVERAHRLAELICNMPGLAPSPLAI